MQINSMANENSTCMGVNEILDRAQDYSSFLGWGMAMIDMCDYFINKQWKQSKTSAAKTAALEQPQLAEVDYAEAAVSFKEELVESAAEEVIAEVKAETKAKMLPNKHKKFYGKVVSEELYNLVSELSLVCDEKVILKHFNRAEVDSI